jgi:hypothetical protein
MKQNYTVEFKKKKHQLMLHSGIMGQTKLILDCGRNKQSN